MINIGAIFLKKNLWCDILGWMYLTFKLDYWNKLYVTYF